jgi:hypothetical protein
VVGVCDSGLGFGIYGLDCRVQNPKFRVEG